MSREPEQSDKMMCGSEVVALAPSGVNVMVAIDGSASMRPHWPRVRSAVEALIDQNEESRFGLHMFWGAPVENLDELLSKANLCGQTQNRVLDVQARERDELLTFLGNAPPGANNRFLPSSPLIEPINYYLENATNLADPERTNYLMLISDGVDNCFGSVFTNPADKRLALEKLAVELTKKNIRVIPIGFVPGQESGMADTPAAQARIEMLDTLARFGGAGLDKALAAANPDDLVRAIGQAGSKVGSCRFRIPSALDPSTGVSPFELNFAVNGNPVARDRKEREGWNFVTGSTSEVELFGKACEAVRGGATVEATKSCSTDICGTAAVKVETKPRAVLYLLDSSASRIECQTGGALSCLRGAGQGVDRMTLTYWEVVQHALGQSLISPINDDVESGLMFFPFKTSGALSCDVAEAPEVPPAPATQITIMSQMLERLPFGRSPVAAALQSVADNPGRLADPDVSGAVVMLTDGGDNCSEGEQPAILASLEQSAAKLLSAGIETYVVRFGKPDNKTPEQEAQLRAIVEHGGTATSDPADMTQTPYIDAVDATALDEALAKVSDRLASCSFDVEGVQGDIDKGRANLYLNGELIAFDGMNQAHEGWGWANAERTTIELYGDACSAFKTNRKTSVVVEFGCESILLL